MVNDINRELTDFWRCLADDSEFREFVRIIEATPFSEYEWKAVVGNGQFTRGRVAIAVAFFIRYRQSRQGLGRDFATLSRTRTRRGMNEQVSGWLSAVEGLPEAHERLKRVVVLNDDAVKVIRQQDGERTHFYLDPPYVHQSRTATDAYEHEMTNKQHAELLDALSCVKGTFQLSGYHSDMYDTAARENGWQLFEFDLPNNASGTKVKERKRECVWMNYDPAEHE